MMDAIQSLRSKAQKAGNLKTTPQQIVTVTNVVVLQTNVTEVVHVTKEIIEVAPSSPSVIYVPSYPPAIYYPWYPTYVYPAPLVSFGVGLAWGMAWGAAWNNHCNWGHGSVDVDIDIDRNVDRNRNTDRNTARTRDRASNTGNRTGGRSQQWKPDQNRMRQSGAKANTREARGWGSGGTRPSTGNVGARPSTGNVGARPSTGNLSSRPSAEQPRELARAGHKHRLAADPRREAARSTGAVAAAALGRPVTGALRAAVGVVTVGVEGSVVVVVVVAAEGEGGDEPQNNFPNREYQQSESSIGTLPRCLP
jgi:hypothetical protein